MAVAEFLRDWADSAPGLKVKFRVTGGQVLAFTTSVCPYRSAVKDPSVPAGTDALLLQLWPEPANSSQEKATVAAPAEDSQAQKQKLDCALQLARTVALDFNNALTSILGHTSHILSQMESDHPWRRSLLEVEKSAERAAEIANDLGTFSRQEKETRTQHTGDFNQLLQRTVDSLRPTALGQAITWSVQLDPELSGARFEEARLQQVFLKVLENAIEALPIGGRIDVRTRNVELTTPTQDRNARLSPGAYVCAEIADHGPGMEPAVLARVFEPFFTTKESHRGLGLALAYGIVTNHGGAIAISSEPGSGTSVRLYLPADQNAVRSNPAAAGDLRGDQLILVVDDEDLLLTMAETVLTAHGYSVWTANTGQKALELLSQPDNAVALVITDLVMPAMSGRELVEKIRLLSSETPILCTSGYVRPAEQGQDPFYLQKPFTSQELLLKVKEALALVQTQPSAGL